MREIERNAVDTELAALEQELKEPLASIMVRSPRTDETQALIRKLQGEFNELRAQVTNPFFAKQASEIVRPSLFKQCFQQMRAYHKSFWLTSAVLFSMMTLISEVRMPLLGWQSFYAFIIPLFMIAGVIYSHRGWNAELRMLESITPFPPALLLLSRMLIILVQCIVYGMIGTFYLKWTSINYFSGFTFMLEWLALVLFVSGVMAYVMFWKGFRWGVSAALFAWLALNEQMLVVHHLHRYVKVSLGTWPIKESVLLFIGLLLLLFAYRRSLNVKLL